MNIIIDKEIRLLGNTARHLAATPFNECLQFLSVGELLQIPRHNKGQPCQRTFAGLCLLCYAWSQYKNPSRERVELEDGSVIYIRRR